MIDPDGLDQPGSLVVQQEIDRVLRSTDWSTRPVCVETPIGRVLCEYGSDTGAYMELHLHLHPRSQAAPQRVGLRHTMRAWIPTSRLTLG